MKINFAEKKEHTKMSAEKEKESILVLSKRIEEIEHVLLNIISKLEKIEKKSNLPFSEHESDNNSS